MKESIEQFIHRKNQFIESREGPILHVAEKLITVDGVDGSGKDMISECLLEKLEEKFGNENVVKIDITHFLNNNNEITELGNRVTGKNGHIGYFNERKQLDSLNEEDSSKIKDQQIDKAFIAGVNRAYTDKIIPALENGKIVIIPRSELNLFRFTLQEKNIEKTNRETKYLLDGTTTAGVLAGNRIFISISPEDMIKNIETRGVKTHLDPENLEEAEIFVNTQKEAEDFISQLPTDKEVNIIRIENNIVEKGEVKNHIEKLCDEIIKSLNIK